MFCPLLTQFRGLCRPCAPQACYWNSCLSVWQCSMDWGWSSHLRHCRRTAGRTAALAICHSGTGAGRAGRAVCIALSATGTCWMCWDENPGLHVGVWSVSAEALLSPCFALPQWYNELLYSRSLWGWLVSVQQYLKKRGIVCCVRVRVCALVNRDGNRIVFC